MSITTVPFLSFPKSASGSAYRMAKDWVKSKKVTEDREGSLTRPIPFSRIREDELNSYAAVFIPGGHAPMEDLGDDTVSTHS